MFNLVFTKLHRLGNFPFFVGIMMFLVPMAFFRDKTPSTFGFFKEELLDAWFELRDDDCGLIFVAIVFLVHYKFVVDIYRRG
jgi:hypothetical protein